jgi:IS30 family transposase
MGSIHGAMTDERKARIWQLWRQGRPMSEIAREISKPPATVYSYLLYHGGIPLRPQSRRAECLTFEERENISRSLASGESLRQIARNLSRSPSTISRELSRNGGRDQYRASFAEKAFVKRSARPKPLRLMEHPALRETVTTLLERDWSPEQISGWLKRQGTEAPTLGISHETIYRSLFVQTRGVFRAAVKKHLRTPRMFRHARSHRAGTRGRIVDAMSIRDRPTVIDDRAIPGHWEGDLWNGVLVLRCCATSATKARRRSSSP